MDTNEGRQDRQMRTYSCFLKSVETLRLILRIGWDRGGYQHIPPFQNFVTDSLFGLCTRFGTTIALDQQNLKQLI